MSLYQLCINNMIKNSDKYDYQIPGGKILEDYIMEKFIYDRCQDLQLLRNIVTNKVKYYNSLQLNEMYYDDELMNFVLLHHYYGKNGYIMEKSLKRGEINCGI